MKKGHIIGLGIIAIAIVIIMTSIGDASSYESFSTAWKMKQDGDDKAIHVVGQLKKDDGGQVTGIQVGEDKTSFTFLLVDNEENKNPKRGKTCGTSTSFTSSTS